MARILVDGSELLTSSNPEGTISSGASKGRRPGSQGFELANSIQATGSAFSNAHSLAANKSHFWLRFYIFVYTLPGVSHRRLVGGNGSIEGLDNSWYLTLGDDGKLYGYNKGNGAKTQIGVSSKVLSLNTWYRVNLEIQYRVAGAAKFDLKIDGSTPDGFTGAGFGVTNGLGQGTQTCSQIYQGCVTAGGEVDAGAVVQDDFVVDDVAEPGAGAVTLLHVDGAGFYNQWAAGGDWRSVIARLPSDGVAPLSHTTATASQNQTWHLETMASRGIPSGATIKSVRVCFRGALPRTNWAYRLRINGVDTDSALQTAEAATNWKKTPLAAQQGLGWLIDAPAIATTDDLEIGIADGTGAGTSSISGAYLIVDWEGSPVDVTETGDIVIEVGSFVGNGTTQDVAFANSSLAPTFMWILAVTAGGQNSRTWWTRGMDYAGGYATGASKHDNSTSGLCRVFASGFTVKGGATTINESAATIRYIAIRDNSGRMINTGMRALNPADNTTDNINVGLLDVGFIIEALIVCGQRWGSSGSSNIAYRDTAYVGDSSSALDVDAAAAANLIQSQGTGTFQVGNSGLSKSPAFNTTWAAFRSTQFTTRRLWTFGTYVGNGGGARVVPYTGIDSTPGLVIVIPETGTARHYRFYNDGAGTTSRSWLSGATSTTSITAFDTPGQFSVAAAMNTNLTVYHYMVFGSGTDPAVAAEVLLPESGIGLTWVELTDRTAVMRPWAKVDLADPSTYYGGFKESRVTKWGRLSRALSDRNGQFEAADFSWETHDVDRLIRGLLAADSTKYFRNSPIVVRMIDDDNRRLLKTPRTVIRGYVSDYRPVSQLHFSWKGQDLLTARFAAQGQKPASVPTRLITAADFPNVPADNVNLPVPIVYGDVSDRRTRTVLVPAVPDFDGSIGNQTYGASCIDIFGGLFPGGVSIQVHAVVAGKEGPISNPAGTYQGGGYQRAVGVFFNAIAGAESYRAYAYDGSWPFDPRNPHANGSSYARLLTHDASTHDGDWASRPYRDFAIVFNGPTSGDDALNPQTSQVTIDDGHGALKPTYVGDQTIGGVVYHKFLVAGHAVKTINELYVDGTPQYINTDATQAGVGGIWLLPGFAGYTAAIGAAKYEDINGNRYSCIYGRTGNYGPDRGAELIAQNAAANQHLSNVGLSLNVSGVESAGDGTGTLITDIFDQYLHVVQNWILATYRAGAYLATPAFEDDSTLKQVDEASFTSSKAIAVQRISSGYVGAGIIGAEGAQITVRDLIARLNLSADCDSGFNRKCQFMVSMVDESIGSLNSATPLTDVLNVYSGSFDITDDLANHANLIPYYYARDYTLNVQGGWLFNADIKDQPSITNYTRGNIDGTLRAPNLELWFVRDPTTATDVAYRRLMRQKDPPRIVKLALGLAGFNYDLGQILTLTHYEGVGAAGWAGQPMRIIRHEADPDQFQVYLECYDMAALFSGAFILGDEGVLPASWPAATTAQKNYGYLCDETTGKFSDGRPGKRLR